MNPDYLTATNPRGFLHASTCDSPTGFGDQFTATMQAQGCTVKRYTPDEYKQLRARPAAQAETAPVAPAADLPPVGTPITHAEHGQGTVRAVLPTFEGTGAVVMAGQFGEYLARPGTFTLTTTAEPVVEPEPLPLPEAPQMDYAAFLDGKLWTHTPNGFSVPLDTLPAYLKPHQKDLVRLGLAKGRYAYWADTGLGKTRIELETGRQVHLHTGGNVLIVAPLGVAYQTIREGQALGIEVRYCRHQDEVQPGLTITNYEMLHTFDADAFTCVILDESSVLKNHAGKTTDQIIGMFARTPYRFAATATPAPNDHTEIGTHAEFLGVMTRTEMLASFFVHDGGDVSAWRLKGHAQSEFWKWVGSWAAVVRRPSDLGHDDTGYDLPALHIHRHKLAADEPTPGMLFAMPAPTLTGQRQAKRDSLQDRCEKVAALVAAEPGEQWLIWCDLNEEGDLLQKLIPGAVQVAGSDSREHKEAVMLGFAEGSVRVLITKAKIAGFGMNWQGAARMAFASVNHSYEQFYQCIRREWRFGQARPVHVHVVYSEGEGLIIDNLARKEADAQRMAEQMARYIRFEHQDGARGRDRDGYQPTLSMTLPAWLKGSAA